MHIFITGICGFVGSTVTLAIRNLKPDAKISGIDNFCRPGSETNRRRLQDAGMLAAHADVRCTSDFESLPGCDWIIDAAANPSVLAGTAAAQQPAAHGAQYLRRGEFVEYARRTKAGFLLLSSNRVYNIPALTKIPLKVQDRGVFLDNSQPLPAGISARGIGEGFDSAASIALRRDEVGFRALALEYGHAFGFPVVVDRCGVLAGETQFGVPEQGIFSFWIRMYAPRRPLKYLGFDGTGHQVRDALHPRDLAELLLRQIENPQLSSGKIWNIGGGAANAMSLASLAASARKPSENTRVKPMVRRDHSTCLGWSWIMEMWSTPSAGDRRPRWRKSFRA